jgi:endoglucanase
MRQPLIYLSLIFLSACSFLFPVSTAMPVSPTHTSVPQTSTQTHFTPTAGPASTPVFAHRFHIEGNAFVDEEDRVKIFRGMASPDPVQMAMRNNPNLSSFDAHYFQVMAQWGANIVRLPITPYSLHTFGWEKTLQVLDQAIAWAGENEMYAIVDFHSVGWIPDDWYPPPANDTTLEEFLQFWKTLSNRYAENNVVAFYELFNEPARNIWPYSSADWMSWKKVAEEAIAVIRVNDPDKIVLVGGVQSSYNLSFVAANPIADGNVGYATHPYSHQNNLSWDAAFGNLSSRYPVFATEFGYDEKGNPDIDISGVPYHQAIIDYLEIHHISWTVWCFDADWQTSLLVSNYTFQPSPSGEYFHSRLLKLNGGG